MKRYIFSIISFFGFIFLFSHTTILHAQSLMDLPGDDPLVITVTPHYPRSGQDVKVLLESYGINLPLSTITWSINGKKVLSGDAETNLSFKTGAVGSTQKIEVSVLTDRGNIISKNITVNPADVDMMWQAYSYTPPFYKGKALYPKLGDVVVVAMPHIIENGTEISANKLIYTWTLNGDNVSTASGYGKNAFKIQPSFGKNELEVGVTVTTRTGNTIAAMRKTIVPGPAELVFYEDSPLYGPIYSNALSTTINLNAPEVRLKVAPFYMSTTAFHTTSPLTFLWTLNGEQIQNQGSSVITLRKPDGVSGISTVAVEIANVNKIFQNFKKSVSVMFKSQ